MLGPPVGAGATAADVTELPAELVEHLDATTAAACLCLPGDPFAARPVDQPTQGLALGTPKRGAVVAGGSGHNATMRREPAAMDVTPADASVRRPILKLGGAAADVVDVFGQKVTCPQCRRKVKVPKSGYCPTKGCTHDFNK